MRDDSWKPKANAAMERWAEGDMDAGEEVYELLAPRVFTFLLRRTRDRAHAQDLLQETFLRMTRSRNRFARGTDVVLWAFAIARNLLIDEARKKREPIDVQRANPEWPDALAGKRRLCDRVMEQVNRLPDAQRDAFVMLHFDELSIAQAAQLTGITRIAMKVRAHRARQALREVLGDELRELLEVPT